MKLTNGNLYWKKETNRLKKYEYLTDNIQCDVLVMGGGISGALSAYYLAKSGLNVVVVEQNIIASGSTAATTALLEYQVDIDLKDLENIIGKKYAKRIYDICKESIDDLEAIIKETKTDVDFKKVNALYYSVSKIQKKEMKEEYSARLNNGFPVQYVEENDILNLKCGILTPFSSVINPYLFTQVLFQYMKEKLNVRIYENTEILKFEYGNEEIITTTNNDASINSKYAILAGGFETAKYLPKDTYQLYKTFTIVTNQIPNLNQYNINFTGRDTKSPYHYIRFINDNRIAFGGEDIPLTPYYRNEKNLEKTATKKYNNLLDTLKKQLKIQEEITIDYAFNGTFATTKDSLPLIDELPNMPNCYCNLGYGANGVLYSLAGAKLLTNLIKGKDTKDLPMFRIDRFKNQ